MKLTEPVAPILSSRHLAKFAMANVLGDIRRIEVVQPTFALIDHCYVNVETQISQAGGHGLYGWKILEFPGLFLQAIHHAVWIDRRNRMIDVTPDVRQWKRQVFAADHGTAFAGVPTTTIAPRTMNISGLAEVDEALAISQRLTEMRLKHALPNGMLPAIDNQDPLVNNLSNQAFALLLCAQAKVGAL